MPGTKVTWSYSQDWEDQAKCKELALNQIAAGSKVVFQVAGGCGLGALSAAKDEGVWGIGVDGDQSFLGPHILTSALKGVDSAVFLTIGSVEDGTFAGGKNVVFGIDQDGVGLGRLRRRRTRTRSRRSRVSSRSSPTARSPTSRRRSASRPGAPRLLRRPAGTTCAMSVTDGRSAPIRCARSGAVSIAYQVTGDGPLDLVLVPGFFSHLEIDWEHPGALESSIGSGRSRG